MMNKEVKILYEDKDILVCVKPHGMATQSKNLRDTDMERWVKNYLYLQNPSGKEPYVAVIHRLDQPVKGILVFARNEKAARGLNKELTTGQFGKYYVALVDGVPAETEGTLEDYLVKDGRNNVSKVCTANTKGAKIARLNYKLLRSVNDEAASAEVLKSVNDEAAGAQASVQADKKQTLLEIHLDTGRHHQIRVQMSHMGCPLVGDTKYNPKSKETKEWQQIHLCAYKLDFKHPVTGKPMHFELEKEDWWT